MMGSAFPVVSKFEQLYRAGETYYRPPLFSD